jgi:hypothetical protein
MNYKRKSGESLSLPFLYIWLAGDFLNVAGATMDNLLLTMVKKKNNLLSFFGSHNNGRHWNPTDFVRKTQSTNCSLIH